MQEYVVKQGDSLWKIAKKHPPTTVDTLAHANRLKGKQLHALKIDQKLHIPDAEKGDPDSMLTLKFRALDFVAFTPKNIKVAHDGETSMHVVNEDKALLLNIYDHAMGLKVWIEDIDKKMIQVLEQSVLPIGKWNVSIDSRKVKIQGNMQREKGKANTTTAEVKAATTNQAQRTGGVTTQEQTRTEGGTPVHALATIYTEENLRLAPGNEQYRALLITAAKKHALTPHSLAALIDAEAEKVAGVWVEKSNANKPTLAQGLAQFFKPAWTDVSKNTKSLLNQDCKGFSESALMAKRLECKYAIDGAAIYANINLHNFTKCTGFQVDSLSPEDKAKVAYLLHHEGLGGAMRLLGKPEEYTPRQATDRLGSQLGRNNKDKLEQLIAQYKDDPVAAYKGWLFSYTDAKINVNHFLVQDAQKFAKEPRRLTDIIAALSSQPPVPKPQPRKKVPSNPAAEAVPTPAAKIPQLQTGAPSTDSVVPDDEAAWFDPLKTCTLRTAHLSSKKAAQFGWTRAGGKKNHQGIDLVALPGTPIYAVADGQVYISKAKNLTYPYGDSLVLKVGINDLPPVQAACFRRVNSGRTTIGFFYAHLSEFSVENGAIVHAGDLIGKTGCTGNAAGMNTVEKGCHLHFEVRQEAMVKCIGLANRVDPLPFIKNCTNR
ncbi:MAG: LysM peptidoglycan-binding domain-containing M23 family metallopeptidase [Glaciimonas sp.]|nr:LysM peptidoglycan-binding domain-containing M23 family metallopeptidase [Glaciimonas sp.]